MSGSVAGRPSKGSRSIAGWRALGEAVVDLTRPLIGNRRAPFAELRAAWSEIAGHRLAAVSRPHRLAMPRRGGGQGTLHLQVASGAAALDLQHSAPLLIARINSCLGYAAVARLKLIHAPLPDQPLPVNSVFAPDLGGGKAALTVPLDGIVDPRLRDALARLARRLAQADSPVALTDDPAFPCPDDTESV